MRILACLLAAVAFVAAGTSGAGARAFCPAIPGHVAYVKAGTLHLLSTLDCTDQAIGAARPRRRTIAHVRTTGPRAAVQRIWVQGTLVFAQKAAGPVVPLALSDDRRWLFFAIDPQASASIAADGLDLLVVSTHGGRVHHLGVTLPYPDYLSWCGGRIVYVQGPDRIATDAKRLLVAAPPAWRPHPLWNDRSRSFASPACDPAGTSVAVLTQKSSSDARFFDTRWQLWRVGLDGSRTLLDRPPAGYADESPSWSTDGGALAFVRERQGHGRLAVLVGRDLYGPLASLGYSLGYYGHHDWGLAWRR